jgi:hypothetical protein
MLRRYFLEKYHKEGRIDVLDACEGEGVLWGALVEEYEVASYWGLDLKPKRGRVKADSVRILAVKAMPQNVIDIDTYGSPWKHWNALVPNIWQPVTVFLTAGLNRLGGGTHVALRAMGMGRLVGLVPASLVSKINFNALGALIGVPCRDHSIEIVEAKEMPSGKEHMGTSVRYFGIRLQPGS